MNNARAPGYSSHANAFVKLSGRQELSSDAHISERGRKNTRLYDLFSWRDAVYTKKVRQRCRRRTWLSTHVRRQSAPNVA